MNQDLSATISKVQEAFKSNIDMHLEDHENDLIRKCSYLNQINTADKLCKIGYVSESFEVAIGELVTRVKKLGDKDQLADAFGALSVSHRVAAIYGFYFLTQFMNDNATNWIEVFGNKYTNTTNTEDDVKGFVARLNNSKEYKIVDKYYREMMRL